jgi:copper(I)-binding protein
VKIRVLLAAAAVAVLAGCGAGQDAQTALTQPSIAGVSADAGEVAVRNAVVLFSSAGYPAGGTAPVQFTVANNGREPVRLSQVTSEAAGTATLISVVLPQASPAPAGPPDGGAVELSLAAGQLAIVTVELAGLTQSLDATSSAPVTLTFDSGAVASLVVPMASPEEPLPREAPVVEGEEH